MKRSLGFTLIEMAIVLVIIGLIAGAAVRVITPLKNVTKTDLTLQHLAIINKALQLYMIQNGCLPCPADGSLPSTSLTNNAGKAFTSAGAVAASPCDTTGACLTTNRVVPWITLNISEDEASDGWGDRIRYIIAGTQPVLCSSTSITTSNGMIRCSTSGSSAFPTGGVTVNDLDANPSTSVLAAYVLISSGSDRASALQAYTGTATGNTASGNQLTNAGTGTSFYKGTRNDSSGSSYFDDIVSFKTPSVLILTCGSNACGNPA
jgi:prepilin-type N-terminal cleavage/methylation domain-containing protein